MTFVSSTQVHTVALVGSGGSGKTLLAEALLVASGAIPKLGSIEDGSTVCDFEPEEVKRRSSVQTSVAPLQLGVHKINILDTPGAPDFVTEVELALAVADLGVLVVSAVDGVEVQTEIAWRLLTRAGVPFVVFVNKLDAERADYDATLGALRAAFGDGLAAVELPFDSPEHTGIADLLEEVAILEDHGAHVPGPIPDDLVELEHRQHDALVEGIVVADDDLMARYLEGEAPTPAELEDTLAEVMAAGTVHPVLCGSARTGMGIERLARFFTEVDHGRPVVARAGTEHITVVRDADGPPLARVIKTTLDPFVGKISLLQVVSGTLRPDLVLINSRTRAEERIHVLETLTGKSAKPVTEAIAGDIVAVPKLADTRAGDTLAPKSMPVELPTPSTTRPSLAVAIRPRTRGDEDRLMTALHRVAEEDLGVAVERHPETHQTILTVMGETHLQVVVDRLARKHHVEIDLEELRVPYRETITAPAAAEGRHKKQSGGHGQFGVVHLRLEPRGRGEGFEFIDQVVGGAIPRQFIPAVEKGVAKSLDHGGVFGYPVVDVRVICDDGKSHPVDSSEASFEMAGALAVGEALRAAGPVLLEPVSRLRVVVPARFQGDVLADVNTRRGKVLASETDVDGSQIVTAMVPTSELCHYAVDLRSLSAGHGGFELEHDHYEPVPPHLTEKLVKAANSSA